MKVNNQYTLEEGERSVFDEEMGEVMVMDSNKYDRPLEKKPVVQRVPRCTPSLASNTTPSASLYVTLNL